MASSVLVVLGSGPGIGSTTAKAFAKQHFSKIALIARNSDRLGKEMVEVQEAGKQAGRYVEVVAYATDLDNFDQLRKTLGEVEKLGPIGCVFYNAARIQPTEILTTPVEEIYEDFRVTNLGLYITAQWAIPLLQQSSAPSPTLFVTSSLLPEYPIPALLSLSAVKASQQNMVHSLRTAFGEGIHFGLIKVGGIVSPEEKNLNPVNIANETVGFYEQTIEQWGSDLVIKP